MLNLSVQIEFTLHYGTHYFNQFQDTRGQVLDRWSMPTREEEPLILQQFLRFGETKPIAQQLLLQDSTERIEQAIQGSREYSDSDIKRFIQRTNRLMPMMPPSGSLAASQASPTPLASQSSCPSRSNKPASSVRYVKHKSYYFSS